MSEIRVGDLVVAVKVCPKCGMTTHLGRVFNVEGIVLKIRCGYKGHLIVEPSAVHHVRNIGVAMPLSWLKKIDPPWLHLRSADRLRAVPVSRLHRKD